LETNELVYVANRFALTKTKHDKVLYKAIEDILSELDMIGNINHFETLLWAFSAKDSGSTELYDHLSKMLINH
jgi:hypothetical protein